MPPKANLNEAIDKLFISTGVNLCKSSSFIFNQSFIVSGSGTGAVV